MGNFHAEIATGHHDRVGEAHDVVDLFEGRGLFDLCHDPGAITDQAPCLDHVTGLLDERQRDPVDPQLQAEGQIGPILLRQRRQIEHSARDVDALAVGHGAARDGFRIDEIRADPGDAHAHPAIVDQEIIARRDRVKNLRMGQRDRHLVAVGSRQHEPDWLSSRDGYLSHP